MDIAQKKKKRRNRDEWLLHVEQWHASGLTQTEYCHKNNLNSCSFSAWKNKFDRDADEFTFVEIKKPSLKDDDISGNYIELILATASLRFSESIDPIRLRNIIIALSEV